MVGMCFRECLRIRIDKFPEYVEKPFIIYSPSVMVHGRPLRMSVNVTRPRFTEFHPPHLACHFQYNNGEALDEEEQHSVQAVYEVTGGVGGGYKARQQRQFLFS